MLPSNHPVKQSDNFRSLSDPAYLEVQLLDEKKATGFVYSFWPYDECTLPCTNLKDEPGVCLFERQGTFGRSDIVVSSISQVNPMNRLATRLCRNPKKR
jgi:hypothetical protein